MRRALRLLPALAIVGCATSAPHSRPVLATVTSSNLFGGQALFIGTLRVERGCLVAVSNGRSATPIFDPNVALAPDGRAVIDRRNGVALPLGRAFRAGSAWLRDDGRGWPVADIVSFFGTRLPPGCPTDDVLRLHDFALDEAAR